MAAIEMGHHHHHRLAGAVLPLVLLLLAVATSHLVGLVRALDNGLARTPPMGWLAWQRFTCQTDCKQYPNDCINVRLFMQMADRLAKDGWLDLGYQYVHIDDCWSELSRDEATKRLVADQKRFPAGIKALADYVHKHHFLKLGIYGDCGTRTCAGYPAQLKYNDTLKTLYRPLGALSPSSSPLNANTNHDKATDVGTDSLVLNRDADADPDAYSDDNSDYGHGEETASVVKPDEDYIIEESTYFGLDAQTLAEWHIDSLKFDGCHIDPLRAQTICSKMAPALRATQRPILLICEWPFYMMYTHTEPDFKLATSSCNVWRYYDDIEDSWLSILNTIDYTVKHQSTILKYHGPGHWFDPDQLVIGNFGLSVAQARAQMALWSIWAAPLYMSNDLRSIKPEFVAILQNKQLIGVNQDELGVFGQMVKQSEDGLVQAFVKPVKPIENGCPSFAIVYLNRNTLGNKQKVSFKVADLLLGAPIRQAARNQAEVRAYKESRKQMGLSEHDDESYDLGDLFTDKTHPVETRSSDVQEPADNQLSDGDDVKQHESGLIAAHDCLDRLKEAAKKGSSGLKYDLIDLFGDDDGGQISIGDDLTLLVSPSGVRAVKLVET